MAERKLSIYDSPPMTIQVKDTIQDQSKPTFLETKITELRHSLREACDSFKQRHSAEVSQLESIGQTICTAKATLQDVRHKVVSKEASLFPGTLLVTGATCFGLLLARRKPGIMRRLLYPSGAMIGAAAFCYPTHTHQTYTDLLTRIKEVDVVDVGRQGKHWITSAYFKLSSNTASQQIMDLRRQTLRDPLSIEKPVSVLVSNDIPVTIDGSDHPSSDPVSNEIILFEPENDSKHVPTSLATNEEPALTSTEINTTMPLDQQQGLIGQEQDIVEDLPIENSEGKSEEEGVNKEETVITV